MLKELKHLQALEPRSLEVSEVPIGNRKVQVQAMRFGNFMIFELEGPREIVEFLREHNVTSWCLRELKHARNYRKVLFLVKNTARLHIYCAYAYGDGLIRDRRDMVETNLQYVTMFMEFFKTWHDYVFKQYIPEFVKVVARSRVLSREEIMWCLTEFGHDLFLAFRSLPYFEPDDAMVSELIKQHDDQILEKLMLHVNEQHVPLLLARRNIRDVSLLVRYRPDLVNEDVREYYEKHLTESRKLNVEALRDKAWTSVLSEDEIDWLMEYDYESLPAIYTRQEMNERQIIRAIERHDDEYLHDLFMYQRSRFTPRVIEYARNSGNRLLEKLVERFFG